jgi:hypothetical protein
MFRQYRVAIGIMTKVERMGTYEKMKPATH